MRSELHYGMSSLCCLSVGFFRRPSGTESARGRDGSTQDHLGFFSYLAAVDATSQMPSTELGGSDSVVEILKAVAHLILNHRQLGLLETAGTESSCDDQ